MMPDNFLARPSSTHNALPAVFFKQDSLVVTLTTESNVRLINSHDSQPSYFAPVVVHPNRTEETGRGEIPALLRSPPGLFHHVVVPVQLQLSDAAHLEVSQDNRFLDSLRFA